MTEAERIELLLGTAGVADAAADRARVAELERKIMASVERQAVRVRRIRIAVIVAWLAVAALLGVALVVNPPSGSHAALIGIPLVAAAHIAVFLSVSWYLRDARLNAMLTQHALAVTQARLVRAERVEGGGPHGGAGVEGAAEEWSG